MTEEQFQAYAKSSNESYARGSPHYRDMPFEEALAICTKDFHEKLVPQGLSTPGHHLLAIFLNHHQIGFLHLGEQPLGSKNLFAWNFEIEQCFRGKGHGKETMKVANEYFKKLNYQKIGLNVFADNHTARSLYEKAGFQVTQINMERTLG